MSSSVIGDTVGCSGVNPSVQTTSVCNILWFDEDMQLPFFEVAAESLEMISWTFVAFCVGGCSVDLEGSGIKRRNPSFNAAFLLFPLSSILRFVATKWTLLAVFSQAG